MAATRVTQVAAEVLVTSPPSNARVTLVAAEVLVSTQTVATRRRPLVAMIG